MSRNLQMPYLKLLSGALMPCVGLGTSGLAGAKMKNILNYSIKNAGYKLIDTALAYDNQVDIGETLQDLLQTNEIQRSDLFLISKIPPWNQGTESAERAIDQILKELKIEYLDMVLIHWPYVEGLEKVEHKHAQLRLETWKAMERAKDAGKIRDLGISNFTIHHIDHLLSHSKHPPSLQQMEIHPFYFDQSLIDYCRNHSIVVQAYASLGKGRTSLLNLPIIQNLAEKYSKTPAQICLKWSVQHGYSIIPKSSSEERLKDNISLFDWELSSEDMRSIDFLNERKKVLPDTNQILNSFYNLNPQKKSGQECYSAYY